MGPKNSDGASKKAEKKKQEKIIEDKTFGLKNKNKSKAVQKYIAGVEQTVKKTTTNEKSKEFQEKAEKKKQKEEEAFLNSLYKQVNNVKQKDLEEGEQAKHVLCAFFKAGCCEKGDDCEFSHDLNIEFNQGTFDIYTDLRDVKKTMGVEFEFNKIAEEKEKKRSKLPQSNIVCKFFLDAVQKKVYGWKWECPNGEECHYKHCLPKSFVLMTPKEKMQEEMTIEEFVNLEEHIDAERERIGKIGTPVTDDTFKKWKEGRDAARAQSKMDESKKKQQTGIQLFKNQANLFKDDDNAEDVEREDNIIDNNETTTNTNITEISKARANDETLSDLQNDLKGIKINTDLFKEEENLDELDDIIDEEDEEETDK